MNRAQFALDLKRIVDAEVQKSLEAWDSLLGPVAKKISIDQAYYILENRVGMGLLYEMDEGGRFSQDNFDLGYNKTFHMKKYGLAAQITEELIEDNKSPFDFAVEIGKSFKKAERETDNIMIASLLNNAIDTGAANLGLDGKPLLSTTHDPDYVSQSNRLAVDADFSESTLESLRHLANSITDKRGLKGRVRLDTLVMHPDNIEEVHRVLGGDMRPGTADNDPNANRLEGDIKTRIFSPYLTDTDATYILTNKNKDDQGLVYVERRPLRVRMKEDEFTESFHWMASKRARALFGAWDCIVGTVGAA